MLINGQKAYSCECACERAVWVGDDIAGDWYCDEPTHQTEAERLENLPQEQSHESNN